MAQPAVCPQCSAPLPPDAPEGLCPKCLMGAGLDHPTGDPLPETTPPTPPGGRFVPPAPAQLARQFPQFEILELIGHGGMGAVYKARQRELDRLVALKLLPPAVAEDPAFAERFNREAKTLAKMNHPHIVGIHDAGQRGGFYFFVMEFVDGVNVRQAIQAKTLSPAEALAVVSQICDALQYAHGLGIVHRDIKPENVLIDKQGRVKIADFGLAKILAKTPTDITLTQAHQVMGTPQYMAPEQLRRPLEVDHRADIYSLGVVFYELLTGDVPMGRFDPPSKRVQIDVRLDEVVLRALEQEPARRYQQVSEMRTRVQTISGMSETLHGVLRAMGREYKSKAAIFGLPLLHVATGIDPKTGRKRIAKGIVALGDVAVGVVAAGGCAMGGVAFGGVSLGLISVGGFALGLLIAIGGLAIGAAAFGGMACGIVAIGGGAVGFYALGGGAWGVHVASSTQVDAEARLFFEGWGENWPKWLSFIGIFTPLGAALVGLFIWLALRSGSATSGWDDEADKLPEGKQHSGRHHVAESHGDQSGFVCAIISLVLFVVGLIAPVILLGVLSPNRSVVAVFTFVVAMLLASVFGLMGHGYRMGRYTAVVAILTLAVIPLAWSFLAIAPEPDRAIEEPQVSLAPVQTRGSEPVERSSLDSDPNAVSLRRTGDQAEIEAVVRTLVSEAAGIPNNQWATLGGDIKGPNPHAVEGMPLSMQLMWLNPLEAAKTNPDVIKDFWYLTEGLPKPGDIDQAVQISKDEGYVSFLQPQYITNVTVAAEGETARGTVGFAVPKLYSGRVHYTARRVDDAWQIVEFQLPNYGITLQRDGNGRWQRE